MPGAEEIPRQCLPWEARVSEAQHELPFCGSIWDPDTSPETKKKYEAMGFEVTVNEAKCGTALYLEVSHPWSGITYRELAYRPKPPCQYRKATEYLHITPADGASRRLLLADRTAALRMVGFLQSRIGTRINDQEFEKEMAREFPLARISFHQEGPSEYTRRTYGYELSPTILDSAVLGNSELAESKSAGGVIKGFLTGLRVPPTPGNEAKYHEEYGDALQTAYPILVTVRQDVQAMWDSAVSLRQRAAYLLDYLGNDARIGPYVWCGVDAQNERQKIPAQRSYEYYEYFNKPGRSYGYRSPDAEDHATITFETKGWFGRYTLDEAQETLLGSFGWVEDEREGPGYRCGTELRLIDGQYAYVRSEKKTELVAPNDIVGLVIPRRRTTRTYRAAWLTEEGLLACIEGDGRYPKELVAHFLKMHPSVLKPPEK